MSQEKETDRRFGLNLFCMPGLFFVRDHEPGGMGGRKWPTLCISKPIHAIEMKLIWWVKHPEMFILVIVIRQL